MLRRLTIQDYGLIPRAEIAFSERATMFTGETGSGKTMVLGALAFALGERASVEVVRRGRPRATVTLEFELDDAMRERLGADGFDLDPDEDATISREISAETGKSSVRLNGHPATAAYVREVGALLVDIAGQHEAQRLLAPSYHVELLDRFAGREALQAGERVGFLHARRVEAAKALASLDSDERRAQEQFAYAEFALEEIKGAAPQPDEDERLTARRRVLDNAEKIVSALHAAHEALAGDMGAASDALGVAGAALGHISDIAPDFAQIAQTAQGLQSEIHDLAARIARESDAVEFDPNELESINARLNTLDALKRKYGGSVRTVLESAQEFRSTIELYGNAGERKAQLERELKEAAVQLEDAAAHLSRIRRGAADRLQKTVEIELKDLALASARLGVQFEPLAETGANGAEAVEFTFAANKGQTQRPLARVASGGEITRVLLALIVVLAQARGGTALVFDEIDAGVGGVTATAVGVRLGRLARHAQVVCVTHLAQIAAWADAHYVLEKNENGSATAIEVRAVGSIEERAAELARMLSGQAHDVALQHARALLEQAG